MSDYAKYLLSPFLIGLHMYGMIVGGNMVWLGLSVVACLLLVDAFLGADFSERDLRFPFLYDVVVGVTMLMGFAQLFVLSYLFGAGHFQTTAQIAGAFVGTAVFGFIVSAPPVHELFHRESTLMRTLGRIGLCLVFDPWREITHVVTHHLHVATVHDPDTARRGDTVYFHLCRTFVDQTVDAYRLEREMWTKRGRNWFDPRNHWVWCVSELALFTAALWWVGGSGGAAIAILSALVGPRLLLEIFNYLNHYGLVTECPGDFRPRHSWNHLTPLVRILALEITNHAEHHLDSYKPFYRLRPDRTGPQQPQFVAMVLLSLVPPLFFPVIKRLLRDWDERFATPKERQIALSENRRAGWESWIGGKQDGNSARIVSSVR